MASRLPLREPSGAAGVHLLASQGEGGILKISVVLNSDSGTLRDGNADEMADIIARIVREYQHLPDVKLVGGPDIAQALKAARDSHDMVLVGGGDGTISTAAAIFTDHETALGILPLGTMNFVARALGIPLALEDAVAALMTGTKRRIDVGEVNGEIFVHHVTLGLHPSIVASREKQDYRSRLGKKLAGFRSWWKLLHQAPRMRLGLEIDGEHANMRTTSLIIANNPFVERLGGLPHSEVPDQGKLAIYAAQTRDWKELLAMSAQASLGKWESNSRIDFLEGRKVVIHAKRKRFLVSVDGELMRLRPPLRVRILPGSLWVLCPAADAAKSGKSVENPVPGGEPSWRPSVTIPE